MRAPRAATASAVAVVQFRTAIRTVRGRLAVLLPGPLFGLLALVSLRMPEELPKSASLGANGHALFGVGILFSLYALLSFSMNQFATDHAGLSLEFLSPIRDLDLVVGKAVGCGMILGRSPGSRSWWGARPRTFS